MNKLLRVRSWALFMRRNMCAPTTQPSSNSDPKNMSQRYRPSNFQKTILVWTKKYKSKDEIPDFVSLELIERSRSEARIKLANVLMLLTALASLGAILAGKAAAKRGESVHQINMDFHKKYQEEYKKREES